MKMIKSRRKMSRECKANGNIRNAYKIFVVKTGRMETTQKTWEDNIKMDIREMCLWFSIGYIWLRIGVSAGVLLTLPSGPTEGHGISSLAESTINDTATCR
jgi:hypothetical protein